MRPRGSAFIVRVLVVVAVAGLIGCAAVPQPLAPGVAAPAPVATASEGSPTVAELAGAPSTPAASSMQKSDYTKRTLTLGGDQFTMKLPCEPMGEKPDKDQTELGPMTFSTFACNYDPASLTFAVLAARFQRRMPAAATDGDRDARSASVAKAVAREACKELKETGTTCKVGTPLLVGGVASVNVKVANDDSTTLRVEARYPFAVAVVIGGGEGASDAANRALGSLELPTLWSDAVTAPGAAAP
jgi:hypothetical protein